MAKTTCVLSLTVLLALFGADQAQAQTKGGPPRLLETIRFERDVPYTASDNPQQCLDILLPKRPHDDKPLPVVMFIHGGGWKGGDKRAGIPQLIPLVETGQYAVISIGYRLSTEAIWPAQIHDCKAAIRWIRANAGKYNLDADHIGVMGPSAGGHLSAMLGTSGDVKSLEGNLGKHSEVSSRVACVVDWFGPSDLPAMNNGVPRREAADSAMSGLLGGKVEDKMDLAREASPVTYVTKDDSPFLIIHGTEDRLVPVDQSRRLHAKLKETGVDSMLIEVEGGGHGNFQSAELQRRIRLFFGKHLRGQDVSISSDAIKPDIAGRPKARTAPDRVPAE